MSFGQSIKSVFANLTNFQGRARRAEFWWFYLFATLVSIPFSVVLVGMEFAMLSPVLTNVDQNGNLAAGDASRLVGTFAVIIGLSLVLGLVAFGLTVAVWVRRLHDVGHSGHLLWLSLVGLSIVPLVMVIMDGQPQDNQYGPDPKAAERAGGWTQPPPDYPAPPIPPAPSA